jgi:hypothetical protein
MSEYRGWHLSVEEEEIRRFKAAIFQDQIGGVAE